MAHTTKLGAETWTLIGISGIGVVGCAWFVQRTFRKHNDVTLSKNRTQLLVQEKDCPQMMNREASVAYWHQLDSVTHLKK
mmetsp:Transcript_43609/g.110020  ORF Transcript_43609/g.110020 Transcript_43609/m.110020 type:complete len:80 (-) Transcript_43609:102-341(-)|eukprot:CAMPEP_0177667134 /NCGR_PEP_ID=MMETSP0447-20121125/21957_1 /TAXON_ID=0 /ORGANISM="Stygamoeba regulata, Strain BSH-02190019" /LENGTH=79 /DNA_ID=CAMNT_0019173337 /DNA_START=44 /DNA_END=283 /DNA_ORIENTATION=-